MTAHRHVAPPRRQPVVLVFFTLVAAALVFVHPAAIALCVVMIVLVGRRLRSERDHRVRRLLCTGLVLLAVTLATAAVVDLASPDVEASARA